MNLCIVDTVINLLKLKLKKSLCTLPYIIMSVTALNKKYIYRII